MNLQVESDRKTSAMPRTGIYVRAQENGAWVNADISTLDRESLLAWMQQKEQLNPNYLYLLVLVMLGHSIPAELVREASLQNTD